MKKIIQDLTKEELATLIKPSFRAKQIYNWIYHKYADSFEEMKNLPKEMREKLDEEYTLAPLKTLTVQDSIGRWLCKASGTLYSLYLFSGRVQGRVCLLFDCKGWFYA
jgi:adenine C2-methylase RlmN of 23S rRNA A2503 and tRNA A37